MKKLILIVTILCLIGCGKRGYTELSVDELFEKIDNKETFVIVLGQETCSACSKYKETMQEVITKEKVEIFYLDLSKLDQEEYAKVYSKFVVVSTPTTAFIIDGVEESTYNRIVGTENYDNIVAKLKAYGFIGE